MWHPSLPAWEFVARASVVYVVVLLLLRLGGKRQVGQMGTPQLVALLLISNAVQNAMNGNDGSVTGGVILAGVIMAWSYAFELATARSKRFEQVVQGRPTLLIHHGRLLRDHLHKERLSVDELRTILRRQGVHDLREIGEAVLESDGYVSVRRRAERDDERSWAAERADSAVD